MSAQAPRKRKRITLRHIKNWILSIVGLTIILIAICFTLVRVAIKYVPDYKESIQQTISENFNIQLEVGTLDAEIYWLVPRLNLIDVNVYGAGREQLIHIDEVDLSLDWINSIRTGIPAVSEIVIDGVNLSIGVNSKSQLIVSDYVVNENLDLALQSTTESDESLPIPVSDEIKQLINNLNFRVLNSNIRLFHARNKKFNKTLTNFNLRLLNSGDEHKFEIQTDLPKVYGSSAQIVVELEGDLFDYRNLTGELYMLLSEINAAQWINDFWKGSALAVNANVNAELWLNWKGLEVTQGLAQFTFADVAAHYLDDTVKTWNLKSLTGQVKWDRTKNGWAMEARELQVVREGVYIPDVSAVSLVYSGLDEELNLKADFVRIEGLAYLSGMMFSLEGTQVDWLRLLEKHNPTGELRNLDVTLPVKKPENIKINTEFSDIGFSLPEIEPSAIEKLQGSMFYYGNETWLALESESTSLKFNQLFRESIDLTALRGVLRLSFTDEEFSIRSNSLYIDTTDISTESRLDLSLTKNGSFLDLTTYFKDGDVSNLSRYLPAGVMGEDAVSWLDNNIKSGRIIKGGYQFYGNPVAMPFRNGEGVSLADFVVSGADLSYLPGWPGVNSMNASLRFLNNSMRITSDSAYMFDSKITQAVATIADFSYPMLDIKGVVETPLNNVKRFLLSDGLREIMPSYLDNIDLSGDGELDLELFIPLAGDDATEWGGELKTQNGNVHLLRENYLLTDMQGAVRFANNYFEILSMQARLDDEPIKVELTTTQDSEIYTYGFKVSGQLKAQSLLAPLPDYKNYLQGKAEWQINLDVFSAETVPDLLLELTAKSDLVGVSSDFPGPMAKPKDELLPMSVSIQMYHNQNMKYDLLLGLDRKLSLHEFSENWVVTADTPAVMGVVDIAKGEGNNRPVKIDLDYFDIDKFVHVKGSEVKAVDSVLVPSTIPALDVISRKLRWGEFVFNSASMNTQKTESGMRIKNFKLVADDYTVNGKGRWMSGWNKNQNTAITATVDVRDLGKALKKTGLRDDVEDADGKIELNLKWSDAPYNFTWRRLQGDADIDLDEGSIKKFDVGAGRMLGVFSLKTLLSLDFADQLSSGFSFDSVKGRFSFAGGYASTRDFNIESKIADMIINGRIGIEQRTVDQIIKVRPHLSSTMTLGSAVVAGPTVGGLVYLFQKIFDPDSLSEIEYSVQGNIDDPEVVVLSAPEEEDTVEEDFFDTDD